MKNYLFFILLILCYQNVNSQTIYYVRQDLINQEFFLSLYDVQTCESTDVLPIDFSSYDSPFVLDLAITPTGDFYFLVATYDTSQNTIVGPSILFKLDLATNAASIEATLPYLCNSLVCDQNNVLYAAGDGFYSYNIATSIGQNHGPLNFIPSGDLMIIDGEIICATFSPLNRLMKINVNTPNQSTVYAQFVLPSGNTVWGMVAIPASCDSTSVFFASANGINLAGTSLVFEYDLNTQSASFLCTASNQISGFTSPEEFNFYNCSIHLDLDADGSSGAPPTDWQAPQRCTAGSLPVADTDATYYSGFYTDSIRLRLLAPTPDAPLEYLTAMPSGVVSASGQGTGWLTLLTSASVALSTVNADFESVLRSVRWHDDAVPSTPGLRTVQVIAFDSEGYSDTSYAFLPVPILVSAGLDTTFEVCADVLPFPLLTPGSSAGGAWSPLPSGVFSPQTDQAGTFLYTVENGLCPADTAFATVIVQALPVFSLEQDTAVCSNNFPVLIDAPAMVLWQDGSNVTTFNATQPGTYWAEQTNAAGCQFRDSILVSVRPVYSTMESALPCYGQPYTWNGKTLINDTLICSNFIALNGCDSTHCLDLKHFYPTLALDTSICGNQTLQWLGQAYSLSGIYVDTISLNGCFTSTKLMLEITPLDSVAEILTICHGEVFNVGGQTFSTSGQYLVTLPNPGNCDTILKLDLTVRPSEQSSQTISLCPGESFVFNGDSLKTPGIYTAKYDAVSGGCDSTATLTLFLYSAISPMITGDTVFCNGAETTLSVENSAKYQWSSGESTANLNTSTPGVYAVTVTSVDGCTTSTAVTVFELPPLLIEWLAGDPLCHGEGTGFAELTSIIGGVEPLSFQLNGTAPTAAPEFDALPAGNWEILATDAEGCTSTFSFGLSDPPELTVELGPSQILEYGDLYPIPVQVSQTGTFNFVWTPSNWLDCANCPNPVATASEEITYILVLTDADGCEASDNLSLSIKLGQGEVYIPNIISPNDDGANDGLSVYGNPKLVRAVDLFRVYDRWGDLLFESKSVALNNESSGWNGEQRGRPVLPGVYVWYAEIQLNDGTKLQKSGDVTVLR